MVWYTLILCLPLIEVLAQGSKRPQKLPPVPSKAPQRPPTKKPSKTPTMSPVKSSVPVNPSTPSKKPNRATQAPIPESQTSVAKVLARAKAQISATIAEHPPMAATYLRLGFHDCVPNGEAGGCNGCVNVITNPENNGLQPAIQLLAPIVAALESKSLGISRADLWAYAALVAVEVSQTTVVFTDNFHVGRKNCETVGTCSSVDPVFCASNGPDVATDFPSSDLTTHGLLSFMKDHFGYDANQTVAIMGAHSIGRTIPHNSGFRGAWDATSQVLDNEYYKEIVGSPNPILAPDWVQMTFWTSKVQWVHPVRHGSVMLNADIAVVRDLGIEDDLDSDGRVQCSFQDDPFPRRCPIASTLTRAELYRNDNAAWLRDFKVALKMMLEKGLT